MVTIWNKAAENSLKRAFLKIREESPQNAEKVRDEILRATRRLADHPEAYPLDKFKTRNPGNFRAFELHSYRIAYRYDEKEVRILRLRHIKQEPKNY